MLSISNNKYSDFDYEHKVLLDKKLLDTVYDGNDELTLEDYVLNHGIKPSTSLFNALNKSDIFKYYNNFGNTCQVSVNSDVCLEHIGEITITSTNLIPSKIVIYGKRKSNSNCLYTNYLISAFSHTINEGKIIKASRDKIVEKYGDCLQIGLPYDFRSFWFDNLEKRRETIINFVKYLVKA